MDAAIPRDGLAPAGLSSLRSGDDDGRCAPQTAESGSFLQKKRIVVAFSSARGRPSGR